MSRDAFLQDNSYFLNVELVIEIKDNLFVKGAISKQYIYI